MSAVLHPDTANPVRVSLNTTAAAEAALRTFWRLAEAWKLTTAEQIALLGVARTTLYQWKQGKVGPLDRHALERLSVQSQRRIARRSLRLAVDRAACGSGARGGGADRGDGGR